MELLGACSYIFSLFYGYVYILVMSGKHFWLKPLKTGALCRLILDQESVLLIILSVCHKSDTFQFLQTTHVQSP